jgi:hypothetical protein
MSEKPKYSLAVRDINSLPLMAREILAVAQYSYDSPNIAEIFYRIINSHLAVVETPLEGDE